MKAEGASLDPLFLFYVVFYAIAPLILGGMFVMATYQLASVDAKWYVAATEITDGIGKTPWYKYPLLFFIWPNVWLFRWSFRLSLKLSQLFKKQTWPMKLLLVYALGIFTLLGMFVADYVSPGWAD